MATIIAASGAAGNWTSGGAWVGGVAPTAADNAQITTTTSSLTIDAGAVCRSADFTGFTGTLTHTSGVILTIGDSTAGLTNIALKLVAGMTYTLNDAKTSAISFISTSATQQTITTAGKNLGNVIINGAGNSYQLQDNYISTGSFTYTAGTTFDTNSKTMTLSGASVTFAGNGKTYFELDLTGSGTAAISGNNTFTNLNRTGTALKTDILNIIGGTTVISGNFTLAGNSISNRLLVKSGSDGNQRIITNTGATQIWSNVDFQDISLSSAYDASAISGGSGNTGNNTGITFTSAVDKHWVGNLGNWSDSTNHWSLISSGSPGVNNIPLPQDNVFFDFSFSGGQTVTSDMPRLGNNIDWTGASGNPTWSCNTLAMTLTGGITLISAMTFTNGTTGSFRFNSSNTANITSSGKTFLGQVLFYKVGGIVNLLDAFIATSGSTLDFQFGTFNANDFNVTLFGLFSSYVSTRVLNMGAGIWTITGNGSGTTWTILTTGLTLNAGTSTISLTDQNNTKNFQGGGGTYYNLTITGGGTGIVIITGANTFNRIQVIGGTKSITLPGSTTTTILSGSGLGNGTNVVTFTASAGSATISKSSGVVSWDYVNLTNIPSTGGATFYAGPLTHSTDGGGNTGWIFTSAPATGGGQDSSSNYAGSHIPAVVFR